MEKNYNTNTLSCLDFTREKFGKYIKTRRKIKITENPCIRDNHYQYYDLQLFSLSFCDRHLVSKYILKLGLYGTY